MRTIWAALLMTACFGGAAAAADPPSATPSTETAKKADALFHEGVRFVTQQSWKEAEEKFLGAWALNPTYDVAANLGQTQYRMGKYRDAAEHLAFALKHWPIIGKKEPRQGAQKRFEEVRGHVGAVKIQVSVAGAMVLVDGKEIGKSPIEIEVYVEPGKRTIEAKLAGYEDAKQTIEATAGGEQSVTLAMSASAAKVVPTASASAPPASSAPIAPPPQKHEGGPGVAWIVGSGALAAVGLGMGIGFVAAAHGADARAIELGTQVGGRSACAGQPTASVARACADLRGAAANRGTFNNVAMVSFIAGGTLALGAVGLGVWASKAKTGATVQVAPRIGMREGGILVIGSW